MLLKLLNVRNPHTSGVLTHYNLDMWDSVDNECIIKPETREKMLEVAIGKLNETQQRC